MNNLTNIKAWHDALVSGEYEQGTGTLLQNGRYCCLGVACHEAIKHGLTGLRVGDDEFGFKRTDVDTPYSETDVLPREVREWLGVDQNDPELATDRDGYLSASTLNDDQGYDFTQIAACIRRTWPDAFVSTNEVTS